MRRRRQSVTGEVEQIDRCVRELLADQSSDGATADG